MAGQQQQQQQPSGSVAPADERGSRKRNNPGRSRVGCLTCRAKHVKCDERLPTCRRCERLDLSCRPFWTKDRPPTLRQTSPARRPLRPRREEIAVVVPAPDDEEPCRRRSPPAPQSSGPAAAASMLTPTPSSSEGFSSWMDLLCLPPDDELDGSMQTTTLDPRDLLLGISCYAQIPYPLPAYQIPLPGSLVLGRDEHLALRHYETTFALSQTPKDPLWSFPRLLLRKVSYSAMTMHFALATSLHELDAQHEGLGGASQTSLNRLRALRHFEDASSTFKGVMSHHHATDHLETLSCFYYIYVYMSRQRVVDRTKLDRLSRTVADYIHTFSLETSLTAIPGTSVPGAAGPALHSFLCRLLFWIYKEDVSASFYGCAGEVARYFKDRPRSLRDVWEVSRPALPLNWGAEYPEAQRVADMETSLAVDMTVEMMELGFDVTELGRSGVVPAAPSPTIEATFALLEVKFYFVFHVASMVTATMNPEVTAFSAAAVAMFYAWKICYRRFTGEDEGIDGFLALLLKAAQRATSATGTSASFLGLQWALLVAGAETKDPIHREWIMSKIVVPQYRSAFRTMSKMEAQTGTPVGVRHLGDILSGACSFAA